MIRPSSHVEEQEIPLKQSRLVPETVLQSLNSRTRLKLSSHRTSAIKVRITLKKIMPVYGTRPEAIKMAPIIKALEASEVLEPVVTVTGQHREMLDQVNELFGIKIGRASCRERV